jgi:alkanesulfonate monooxygenase
MSLKFLWYIPNTVQPGHRGDEVSVGLANLHRSTELARLAEDHGWSGALLGTGWGRPDTFTVATALAARTTTFEPLIAIRPGFWRPAHFASASATLDQISEGRVLVNVVSGIDNLAAYGDREGEQAERYARTGEFIQLVRRLWSEDAVTFRGEHFWVESSTLAQRPYLANAGRHPLLYFGGASPAAERVSATEADVQLFWGEPLDGIEERISRLRGLSESLGRAHPPLEFGLRVTTVVRETNDEAWHDAEQRVAKMAEAERQSGAQRRTDGLSRQARGQQRLVELAERGDVLDTCLYTAPGKYGGDGAGTTWLVGSYDDVAGALRRYRDLGVTHFVLSDTPYKQEAIRVGDHLLRLLHEPANA